MWSGLVLPTWMHVDSKKPLFTLLGTGFKMSENKENLPDSPHPPTLKTPETLSFVQLDNFIMTI